jgi:hypothetical protein
MPHTRPPLRIGFRNGVGYSRPFPFEREIGEPVEVLVETACSVRFDDHQFFDNKDYARRRTDIWRPNDQQHNGTPKFDVYPYHRYAAEGSHSIKIGSGLLHKRKGKAKSTKATAKRRNKSK